MEIFGIGFAIFLVVVAFIVMLGTWAARYRKVGPDEVLIISGRKRDIVGDDGKKHQVGFRIVRNGGTFVWPVVEKIGQMSLRVMDIEVITSGAMSKEGVPLDVTGTALFKIAGTDEGISNAAERYMGVKEDEIRSDVRQVLEGHLRGVCGTLTPEDIYRDRTAFQAQITEQAQADLRQLGITLDTLTLREIRDSQGYLDSLGQTRTAEVQSDARIGKAQAEQAAAVAEAMNRQIAEVRQAEADADIAEATKVLEVRRAQYNALVLAERATAEQAGPLAQAKAQQNVTAEQTKLAEAVAKRREAELEAEVVKPAEAKRRAVEIQAEAEQRKLSREGEGEAEKIRQIGRAEAEAIEAKLLAEARGLEEKAKAMAAFNAAGMNLQVATELIHILPQMVTAAATPLASIKELRLLDFGGDHGNGNSGPLGKLLDVSPRTLASVDETLKQTLGTGLMDMITLLRKGESIPLAKDVSGEATPAPKAESPVTKDVKAGNDERSSSTDERSSST